MEKELDCRGLQCPEPVVRCRKLIDQEAPEKLAVLVDNQAALENVSRFLGRMGYETTVRQNSANEWRIEGSKNSELAASPGAPAEARGKTLVLLTTSTLGHGDDTLGAKLMETFLATLPELGPALWRIVLLNGGVKLAAEEGSALESLKKLAQSGVSILVCGTCLTYYDLLDKKQIGETTNMMDVMTSLALADKVIRP